MSTINKALLGLFLALSLAFFGSGCTKKDSSPAKVVNLAIWGNYYAPDAIEKFFKETGVKINVTNYSSNEELLAKIQSGSSGIDVAVPSDYMVQIMIKSNLLAPLDVSKIPNAKLIEERWMKQSYDPENKYSLAYGWTTAGIAVNRELFKGKITGWKDVLDSKELDGKISLLDDVREVSAIGLKINGLSVNTTKPEDLAKAKVTMLALKKKSKMFRTDSVSALTSKEVIVAHAYSGDAMQAMQKMNGKIEYIIPAEGGTQAIDNIVIFKDSKNIENAHTLINFLMSEDNNVNFVKTMFVGPVLKTTHDKLPAELQKNSSLFPSKEVMSRLEKIEDLGEKTQLYDDLWTRVKSE